MSYYEDLTPHTYSGASHSELTVGWLEDGHAFATAPASDGFVERLAWLCVHTRANAMRGFHICSLCPPSRELGTYSLVLNGKKHLLGSAEIRVAGKDAVYAAPNLILHYVVDHAYAPPKDFVLGVSSRTERLSRESWSLFRGPYWE